MAVEGRLCARKPRLVGSLCGKETSPVILGSAEETSLNQAPLQGVVKRAPGAGKEAEYR